VLPIIIITILTLTFVVPTISVKAITTPTVKKNGVALTGNDIVQVGDVLEISGVALDVTSGATVKVYWDTVQEWGDGAGLLNQTTGDPDGSYSVEITVPDAVNGTHYIWVKDTETGETARSNPIFVGPTVSIDPLRGLPGDTVTVTGTGFSGSETIYVAFGNHTDYENVTTTPSELETDAYGSFTCTIDIPGWARSGTGYGKIYNITGLDDQGVVYNATFAVGASITLTPEEGPSGIVVTITGRGFTANEELTTLGQNITIGGWPVNIVDDTITIDSNGEFEGEFVVPSLSVGDYEINVTDNVYWANATFTVNGETAIEVTPTYGAPGATITVKGYNFTQIADTEVALDLNGTDLGTATTAADGTFTATFTVPAVAFDDYVVNATDDYGLNATDGFKVGIIAVIISPTSGPTGTEVTITGTGFEPGDYNATFGDEMVIEGGTVGTDETLSDSFYVPTVDPGTYSITVVDTADNEISVTFEVTATTTLSVSPSEAPLTYNVTFTGENFAEDAGAAITWYVFNSTWSEEITGNVTYGGAAVTVTEDGNFTAYWVLPNYLILGKTYTINATDADDLWAETTITIVEEETEIAPNAASYSLGDTITFTIKATFAKENSYLEIKDPNGTLYFTATFTAAEWTKVGDWQVVQIRYQVDDNTSYPFIIPSDASTGTWSWTLYDEDDEEIASGTFEVLPTTAEQVDQRLSDLETSVSTLSEDVSGLSEDISDVKTDISGLKTDVASAIEAANAAKSAAASAADAVSDIAETANSAKSAAENAASAASEAKSAAEEAKSAASGLTTLVYGAIGASLVAALAAIVSLMQISRRIAG